MLQFLIKILGGEVGLEWHCLNSKISQRSHDQIILIYVKKTEKNKFLNNKMFLFIYIIYKGYTMNIEEINSLLGINPLENPFVQQEKPQEKNEQKDSFLKNFNIMDILKQADKQEVIEILGDDLLEETNPIF